MLLLPTPFLHITVAALKFQNKSIEWREKKRKENYPWIHSTVEPYNFESLFSNWGLQLGQKPFLVSAQLALIM